MGSCLSLLYPILALTLIKACGARIPGAAQVAIKLYPAALSAVLLGVFGWSLIHPPSVVERLARARDPGLPEAAADYARAVTKAWCLFFVLNGAAALATAVWASDEAWALYNGFIAYLLMGALAGAERLARQRRIARGWT